MPLNETPKHLGAEARSLIDSALEQAWQELLRDGLADYGLARRRLAGTIIALASVGETDPAKLNGSLCMPLERPHVGALMDGNGRRLRTTFAKRRTCYVRRAPELR